MRLWRLIGAGALGATVLSVSMAWACGMDGVPSLSVNGHLVARNTVYATTATFDTWTPFIAHGVYPARRPLLFSENRANIAQSLPPVAMKVPWRWHFGDGATARGTAVRHMYRHGGAYIVSVDAYFGTGKYAQWYTFDKITLHVH